MAQQRQRSVVRMDITLRLMRQYHKPDTPETGNMITYDIQQLRQQPSKLE